MTSPLACPADVLHAWFGTDPNAIDPRWFRKDEAFDAHLRERFGAVVDTALEGGLGEWERTLDGRRALLIVLDQFPRNLYRGDARAFAGDVRALALCNAVIDSGDDRVLNVLERWFVYLPLMHAEDLASQDRSVALFTGLAAEDPRLASALDFAHRHRDVIVRFGRYPHRNQALGRTSSPEEREFLKQPGSGF